MTFPTEVTPAQYAELTEIKEATGRGERGGTSGAVPGYDKFIARSLQGLHADIDALETVGPPAGTVTNATLRWSGSQWVQNANFTVDASGNGTFGGNVIAGGASSAFVSGDGTDSPTFVIRKGAASNSDVFDVRSGGTSSSAIRWRQRVQGASTDIDLSRHGADGAFVDFVTRSDWTNGTFTVFNNLSLPGSGDDGDGSLTMSGYLKLGVFSDATRGAAGTAGRVIFNTTDGNLNIDDGTNWILPDGTTT